MSEWPPRECTCDLMAHPCEIHDCTGGEPDVERPSKSNPLDGSAPEPVTDPGEISDGYHTFNELYEHRHALWCALAANLPPGLVWKSRQHDNPETSMYAGYFVAGAELPGAGQITYHLPERLWSVCPGRELERAPEYDGHTPAMTVERLYAHAVEMLIREVW